MYLSSGIGVYLQNLLPRIARTIPPERMTLLGNAVVRQRLAEQLPGARISAMKSGIYTLREQVELLLHRPSRGTVWWSPHYNIPLGYAGPLVVTVHDLFHLVSAEVRASPLKLAYARMMFRAIQRKADRVICVSRFTADQFERLLGGKAGQLEVIHNGVDEGWLEPVTGTRLQANPYFLFVGNLKPNKNVHGLIQAFSYISERLPHDLVIVGQTSGFITQDRDAERLAAAMGSRVKFTGQVDLATLRRWYRYAEAFVFPSFYEGFGFPPLEAMAVGCPVVASNAASLPEICGDAVLYCDPHDTGSIAAAIVRIVEDGGLREQLVTKGLVKAKEFGWTEAAARTSAVLQSLM
jgi:glycosyltransferase involved in cell wall biosynthesis